jgi:RHS repeat-associated protein
MPNAQIFKLVGKDLLHGDLRNDLSLQSIYMSEEGGQKKGTVASDYRYGFNGMEMDDEVKGEGNSYSYGFRIYNPRIGKFLSTDPLFKGFPWYTPYQFAGNTPIAAIDLDGLEEFIVVDMGNGQYWVTWDAPQGPCFWGCFGWVKSPFWDFSYSPLKRAQRACYGCDFQSRRHNSFTKKRTILSPHDVL